MALLALLCSQIILILWVCWIAARVRRLSGLASRVLQRARAPEAWESRLLEVQADLVSLSSSCEKVFKQVTRLNSRAGMRELRETRAAPDAAPPFGASKAQLREYYRERMVPKKIAEAAKE